MAQDTPFIELDQHVLDPRTVTNEKQKVDLAPVETGKTIQLTFDGETTTATAAKASITAAEVKAKLEALSNIEPGDVIVTGTTGSDFTVEFTGNYEGENVPTMTATASAGPAPTITVLQQGGVATKAVRRGAKPLADATDVVNPLLNDTPNEQRAAHAADYGDA